MENKKKIMVSILIPAYNSSLFIGELLNSIIMQKNVDIEDIQVVVTDDASQDTTVQVLETYKNKIPNLYINVNKTNQGITKNCNIGLTFCKGKYCMAIGADDVLMPDRISSQLEWFRANPNGILCSSGVEVFEHGTQVVLGQYIDKDFLYHRNKNRIISQLNQLPTSRFMFNREKLPNLIFDERTPVVSDWLFYNEMLFHGDYGDTGKIGVRYRRHDNNTTKSGKQYHYMADRLIAIDILFDKHPGSYSACKRQRSHTFYNFAKRLYLAGNKEQINNFLIYSIREDMTNVRPYMLFILSNSQFFGTLLMKIFYKWKKIKLSMLNN